MAKMKGDMSMTCAPGQCGPKCIIMGLIAAAFAAGGLWMLVGAVMKQWSGMMPWTNIFLWYFGGLILVCISKCIKMKACGMCRQM